MVDKNIIEDILDNLLSTSSLEVKCNKPGYKSPQQRLQEFLNGGKEKYQQEQYTKSQDPTLGKDGVKNSPIGKLQRVQNKLQDKINWSHEEQGLGTAWNISFFGRINRWLYKKSRWEEESHNYDGSLKNFNVYLRDGTTASFTVPEMIDGLHNLCQKAPSLTQPTCFYRFGSLPSNLKQGDTGKFDGFTSASYNSYVATKGIPNMGWTDSSSRKVMRLWADTGTKGVVMNKKLVGADWQSEFLMDKGTKYVVADSEHEEIINGKKVLVTDLIVYN